jgi:hypothetical protein
MAVVQNLAGVNVEISSQKLPTVLQLKLNMLLDLCLFFVCFFRSERQKRRVLKYDTPTPGPSVYMCLSESQLWLFYYLITRAYSTTVYQFHGSRSVEWLNC